MCMYRERDRDRERDMCMYRERERERESEREREREKESTSELSQRGSKSYAPSNAKPQVPVNEPHAVSVSV